jgi:cell division protein FtsB
VKKRGGGVPKTPLYIGALALSLGLFFYFFLMPLLAKKKAFRARMTELKSELGAEQETHGRLQHERRLLEQNDPAYLEKYARDNFGWAREGEIVYKLEKPR